MPGLTAYLPTLTAYLPTLTTYIPTAYIPVFATKALFVLTLMGISVDFFLVKYLLTNAQVIKAFFEMKNQKNKPYSFLMGDNITSA